MTDRTPAYPGRVRLTPVEGQENVYTMTRADEPTDEGTPLNKANLLSDTTAAALGLIGDPTVNEALAALANKTAELNRLGVLTGSYDGNGGAGKLEPKSIFVGDVVPKWIFIFGTHREGQNVVADYGFSAVDSGILLYWLIGERANELSYNSASGMLTWISNRADSQDQFNVEGVTYYWLVIGERE